MKRAYTLTELLIVMVIIVILIVVSLPLVRRVMDSDRVREASRQFSAYVNRAKTQAQVSGRPAGLILILDAPLGATDNPIPSPVTRQCTTMFAAEVPPNYQGGTQGARAIVRVESGVVQFVPLVPVFYYDAPVIDVNGDGIPDRGDGVWDDDANMDGIPDPADADSDGRVDVDGAEVAMLQSLVPMGDYFTVKFDHKNPAYLVERTAAGFVFGGAVNGASHVPPYYGNVKHQGSPYTIVRSPQPFGAPLELTGGACIDLAYSGAGPTGNEFILHRQSIAMMFSPSGSVQAIYPDGTGPFPPDGTLHFLIGRVGKMDLPLGPNPDHPSTMNMFDQNKSNLATADSVWVSINRMNGKVTSAENTPAADWTDFTAAGQMAYLAAARGVATAGQQMSGQ